MRFFNMSLSISRGTVRHTLRENIQDLMRSVFFASSYLKSADRDEIVALEHTLQKNFPKTQVAYFPFARTGLHAILSNLNMPKGSKILMTPYHRPNGEVIKSLARLFL